ncbi:MAG: DNA-3-methyladenine glycosylase 2 family protein, partial [Myxococcales bacterium]|nr:DNA-3-methyladenine glycosylase 2 family protein [Myxococcales bacterium]
SPRRDYFRVLLRSLFGQQLATKTAATLYSRFCTLFPNKRPTPSRVREVLSGGVPVEVLAWCGLSRQKRVYVLDLAVHFDERKLPIRRLREMSDDEIVAALTRVKGIGVWTAQMFLLFALNRPDVWPTADLGLQEGVRDAVALRLRPTRDELLALGEAYRPWRSVATWYFWRGRSQAVWPRATDATNPKS